MTNLDGLESMMFAELENFREALTSRIHAIHELANLELDTRIAVLRDIARDVKAGQLGSIPDLTMADFDQLKQRQKEPFKSWKPSYRDCAPKKMNAGRSTKAFIDGGRLRSMRL